MTDYRGELDCLYRQTCKRLRLAWLGLLSVIAAYVILIVVLVPRWFGWYFILTFVWFALWMGHRRYCVALEANYVRGVAALANQLDRELRACLEKEDGHDCDPQ